MPRASDASRPASTTPGLGAPGAQTSAGLRKALFVYSLTGGSHLRVAQTLSNQLRTLRPDCESVLFDGLKSARFGVTIDPARVYAVLTIHLIWLFNLLYWLANTPVGVRMLRQLIRWAWGKGIAEMIDHEAPDLVVSTHPFFSPSTHGATLHRPRWVTVVTDLGIPPRVWFDPECDALIVSTPEIADLARSRCRVSDDRIVALDYEYPIDPRFEAALEPRPEAGTILVLGGGAGAGNLSDQVSILRQHFPTTKVVVICGHNDRLRARLARRRDDNLDVLGFVDCMDDVLRQADIVVSKAGPATIVEAAAMRKPLIITGWVGLQERGNVELVVGRKLGLWCPTTRDLPAAVRRIYQEYEAFNQEGPVFRSGAEKIARLLTQQGQP